jgi:all-trans-retinol dehydrogenase (NAD+)
VTGGGSGIGRLLCEKLSEEGVQIIVTDINKKGAEETVELIRKKGGKADCFVFDVSNYEAVYSIGDEMIKKIGNPTILVNNAGIVTGTNIFGANEEKIMKTMEVNVNAHFWTVKKFVPYMMEKNNGTIISM